MIGCVLCCSGVPVMLCTSHSHRLQFSRLSHSVPKKSVCSWLATGLFYPKPTRPVSHLLSWCTASSVSIMKAVTDITSNSWKIRSTLSYPVFVLYHLWLVLPLVSSDKRMVSVVCRTINTEHFHICKAILWFTFLHYPQWCRKPISSLVVTIIFFFKCVDSWYGFIPSWFVNPSAY
jgi:hypothetical protein